MIEEVPVSGLLEKIILRYEENFRWYKISIKADKVVMDYDLYSRIEEEKIIYESPISKIDDFKGFTLLKLCEVYNVSNGNNILELAALVRIFNSLISPQNFDSDIVENFFNGVKYDDLFRNDSIPARLSEVIFEADILMFSPAMRKRFVAGFLPQTIAMSILCPWLNYPYEFNYPSEIAQIKALIHEKPTADFELYLSNDKKELKVNALGVNQHPWDGQEEFKQQLQFLLSLISFDITSSEVFFRKVATDVDKLIQTPWRAIAAAMIFIGIEIEDIKSLLTICAGKLYLRSHCLIQSEPGGIICQTSYVIAFSFPLLNEESFTLAWPRCIDNLIDKHNIVPTREFLENYLLVLQMLETLKPYAQKVCESYTAYCNREHPDWLSNKGVVDINYTNSSKCRFQAAPAALVSRPEPPAAIAIRPWKMPCSLL